MDSRQSYKFRFGAAFYAEYHAFDTLDEDMRLLAEAHCNTIRVGEGSWSHWEPEDGRFDLDWLEPVLDKAHEYGVEAIIGVPTFAIPLWLARACPEITLVDIHGRRSAYGSREEHSYTHPTFRYYSRRIIEAIVQRYRNHPAVIGWQLHNEPGLKIDYSPFVFEGFKDELRREYGNVEELNRQWGLVFWSHELTDWDDLWEPSGNDQPQYDIAWRRYQAKLTDDMLREQRDWIRALCRDDQFITVNFALARPALDEAKSAQLLDVVSFDPYYQMQDGMLLNNPDSNYGTQTESEWKTTGPWGLSLNGDRIYALKQQPFGIAECNGGPIGGSADRFPGYDGQWRQAAWQFILRGAQMIEYWPWRQITTGAETFWGGIIPHDGKPGRVYHQIAQLGAELESYGTKILGLHPDYDITMLYSVQSRWAMECEPYQADNGFSDAHDARNPQAYEQLFRTFYQGAFLSGRQTRIVYDTQIIDDNGNLLYPAQQFVLHHPVLVAAGTYMISDQLTDWLKDYVQCGGHLIIGPETGIVDELARAQSHTQPAGLQQLAGASYQETSNLLRELPIRGCRGYDMRPHSAATIVAQHLEPTSSETLCQYEHPFFSGFAAATTHQTGAGRVTVVGTIPNRELMTSIYDVVLAPASVWSDCCKDTAVTHTSAVNENGDRLHALFNWSWDCERITLPSPCSPANGGEPVQEVLLRPWDVRILAEKPERTTADDSKR
ncbi:beta-galactosidase [Bifidobacterium olomucense]|uniref:beta-galactosidase n=1 Tax=Bifidobacterium olomucense TaxID=2675324 RepID=A0A7Y0EZA4_9BIFI|nr:beta-galactosidase [Bifidobacterium sp. DSM 109959]NMM99141.1 beta-galactosidase [Bifidobacterium sp. DSM 109959]